MAKKRGDGSRAPKGCTICGGQLGEYGFCATGGGFPGMMACPFTCPFCRRLLSWDGGCNFCHGTLNKDDRASWSFPGDHYHLEQGHWQLKEGPSKACTPEQNMACMMVVQAVLDKKISELRGQERIQEILNPVPF